MTGLPIRGACQMHAALPFVPSAEVCGEMVALGDAHPGGEWIGRVVVTEI